MPVDSADVTREGGSTLESVIILAEWDKNAFSSMFLGKHASDSRNINNPLSWG